MMELFVSIAVVSIATAGAVVLDAESYQALDPFTGAVCHWLSRGCLGVAGLGVLYMLIRGLW